MKANAPLCSLNAGEVSEIALTRVDLAKLRMAAACQVNWLPCIVGPMAARPVLRGSVNGANPTRALPIEHCHELAVGGVRPGWWHALSRPSCNAT